MRPSSTRTTDSFRKASQYAECLARAALVTKRAQRGEWSLLLGALSLAAV